MQAVQNFGLALTSLLAGLIVDNHGYLWLEVFFVCWLALATFATVSLWIVDKVCKVIFAEIFIIQELAYKYG